MLAAIKATVTATWKANAAAIAAGLGSYALFNLGVGPEPDPAAVAAATSGIGEVVFAVINGVIGWVVTYFSPANK